MTLAADLKIANLVARQATEVAVYGTAGSDQFTFDASAGRTITVNGISYRFDDATSFTYQGTGNDHLNLVGRSDANTAVIRPRSAIFRDAGYSVIAASVELTSFDGGGGDDSARLYGSRRENTLAAYIGDADPDRQQAVLTGGGLSITARAANIRVDGRGGMDSATVNDSASVFGYQPFWKWERLWGADGEQQVRGFKNIEHTRQEAAGPAAFNESVFVDAVVDPVSQDAPKKLMTDELAQLLLLSQSESELQKEPAGPAACPLERFG